MARESTIAVAQTCPRRGDVLANLEEHVALARLATRAGARIVVFPELSLTGYELDLAADLAFSRSPRLSPLLDLAASEQTTLIVGAPIRLESALHIGAFVLSPDRSLEIYTKRRLGAFSASALPDSCDGTVPPAECTIFRAADNDPFVRVDGVVAAIAVCADVGDPAHPRRAAERGANTYLASMFVIPTDFDGEATKLSGHAKRHSLLTALANFGAPSGGLRSAGRSSIWSASGELLVQLEAEGAGVALVSEAEKGHRTSAVMLARALSSPKSW